ncbi:MAG TPA: tetratricopeptide repeat protein, partial [Edaphobacter sp.]|nr:tetratricopeptide repeat protein [Edaphobacter sp.]
MTGKATFRGSCCQKVLGALRSYTLAGGLVAIVCSQVSNASAFVPKQALGNDISAETLQRRGAQYLRDSRFANAETAYRAALQIDPKL